jgi:hypothetical protein
MLSSTEIDVLVMLSWAVWCGLLVGFFGLLTGALILGLRTHSASGFILGALRGVLLSAGMATAVSLLLALAQMALCKPGHKAGWEIPVWASCIQAVANFIAGVIGPLVAPRLLPKMLGLGKACGMAFIGATLGAVANLLTAFDGYYVLESNARPVYQAIVGFVTGLLLVLLWRFAIEMLRINNVLTKE